MHWGEGENRKLIMNTIGCFWWANDQYKSVAIMFPRSESMLLLFMGKMETEILQKQRMNSRSLTESNIILYIREG
jgi:hypothetical protein